MSCRALASPCDTYFYRGAVEVHRRRPDALHAAQFGEVDPRERFLRPYLVGRADGRFDHAARSAEDDRRAGRLAQRTIEILLFERGEVEVGETDQVGQFAGGDGDVDVRVALPSEFRSCRFGLFGHAGHHGDHDQFPAVDAQLLCEVVFGDGAEHLLRRLGRGEVAGQLREVFLHEAHPARAAGGHERQLHVGIALEGGVQAAQQLRTLLHDGEVGGEVGVEYVVETQPSQRRHHLARHAPARIAEVLSETHAHGGGGLHHHRLGGVGDGAEHIGDVGVL